jgi:hypothetical protein
LQTAKEFVRREAENDSEAGISNRPIPVELSEFSDLALHRANHTAAFRDLTSRSMPQRRQRLTLTVPVINAPVASRHGLNDFGLLQRCFRSSAQTTLPNSFGFIRAEYTRHKAAQPNCSNARINTINHIQIKSVIQCLHE